MKSFVGRKLLLALTSVFDLDTYSSGHARISSVFRDLFLRRLFFRPKSANTSQIMHYVSTTYCSGTDTLKILGMK